jgi:hypothetical protein
MLSHITNAQAVLQYYVCYKTDRIKAATKIVSAHHRGRQDTLSF